MDEWLHDAKVADSVVHLAWASSARHDGANHGDCLTRTRLLLDYLSLVNQSCRVVFASTCAVYGHADRPTLETGNKFLCATWYAMAKDQAEDLMRRHSTPTTVLRLGSLMGRGLGGAEKTDVTVNAFAADAYSTGKVTCWCPDAWKPLVHVRDAAEVVRRAVESPDTWTGVTNVSWKNVTAGKAADTAARLAGASLEYVGGTQPSASVSMDNSLLRSRLGKEFRFRTLEEAVREFEGYVPAPGHKFDPARWSAS